MLETRTIFDPFQAEDPYYFWENFGSAVLKIRRSPSIFPALISMRADPARPEQQQKGLAGSVPQKFSRQKHLARFQRLGVCILSPPAPRKQIAVQCVLFTIEFHGCDAIDGTGAE
eukprot:GEMP01074882.1.p2 GENE.GEMP01074882.1~~GEMP01074882.1.p2  ORF type:complete len:115 (+),score=19.63 GEMP01074882.1:235-579(+)